MQRQDLRPLGKSPTRLRLSMLPRPPVPPPTVRPRKNHDLRSSQQHREGFTGWGGFYIGHSLTLVSPKDRTDLHLDRSRGDVQIRDTRTQSITHPDLAHRASRSTTLATLPQTPPTPIPMSLSPPRSRHDDVTSGVKPHTASHNVRPRVPWCVPRFQLFLCSLLPGASRTACAAAVN